MGQHISSQSSSYKPKESAETVLKELSDAKSDLLASLNLHCDRIHKMLTQHRQESPHFVS